MIHNLSKKTISFQKTDRVRIMLNFPIWDRIRLLLGFGLVIEHDPKTGFHVGTLAWRLDQRDDWGPVKELL